MENNEKAMPNCHKLRFVGKHYNGQGCPSFVGITAHRFTVQRSCNKFDIHVNTALNRKEIEIVSDSLVSCDELITLWLELLRFDSLLDGRFFPATFVSIDNKDRTMELSSNLLSFYQSTEEYLCLPLTDDNVEYQNVFSQWVKICDDLGIINQMFLYNAFVKGNSIDIRLGLILGTLEAVADYLGDIKVISFSNEKAVICPACKQRTNPITLNDKLTALVDSFGKEIFSAEAIPELIKRSVRIRNQIAHVRRKQNGKMTAEECGVSFIKYCMLYRRIILSMLGCKEENYMLQIKEWVGAFNDAMQKYLIT